MDTRKNKRMTIRERLELMKDISRRNEERRKAFVEQEKREHNERLFDMYVEGLLSREEFERRYKK